MLSTLEAEYLKKDEEHRLGLHTFPQLSPGTRATTASNESDGHCPRLRFAPRVTAQKCHQHGFRNPRDSGKASMRSPQHKTAVLHRERSSTKGTDAAP